MSTDRDELVTSGIAIVGMAGRFPGARDLDTFWRNVCQGTESITFFRDDELDPYNFDARSAQHPAFVKARGVIEDAELFDAAFFGISGRDALLMDPQQRLFIECCWEALERAGYDPRAYKGLIGVYGGASPSRYQPYLYAHYDLLPNPDPLSVGMGNDLQYLTTRVSYKLDLKGPSYPVTTACSTSLVAVHLACQGLLNAECDLALAGGVSVQVPQRTGYWYQEDSILSPDGHCRSFDAAAAGTVFSNGLGLVVLKRLDDALADGDTIYAVIRGSAINNDGSRRASFTAPGVYGQSQVVADALAAAGVDSDSIGYIEAHGTATSLGDSIEVQALTKAFSRGTSRKQYCAIGTVKANIGHLDAAAGVAGLIKASLMLQQGQLPPAAMFERTNPELHLEETPFYVNTRLREWPSGSGAPRRAGVSSFGFGGTNAHVVVEEPPAPEPTDPSRAHQLLVLSAESADGLERATAALGQFFARHPQTDLADAAYTLKVGRRGFRHRRAVVCSSVDEARTLLESRDPRFVVSGTCDGQDRPVVFMFPGQGSQHLAMGRGLYEAEAVFREVVDECSRGLQPHLGVDLRTIIFADAGTAGASDRLTRTRYAQPALFVIEYALARLWMSWGIRPDAMIGHSVGELVAACLAGVMTLSEALQLVAARGRLMEDMPEGVMLAVPLGESQIRRLLGDDVWLAAVNAPSMCVVSGTASAIAAFEQRIASDGIEGQRLQTSHAFHSGLMAAAVTGFTQIARSAALKKPAIPFISNVSGTWISDAEATDPAYWARQIRETVRFADGAAELLKNDRRIFLEVGPGQALTTLMRRQVGRAAQHVVASLRRPSEQSDDTVTMAGALGRLWLAGGVPDWAAFYGEERRRRIPLPTYPFDRQRYWVSRPPAAATARATKPERAAGRIADVSQWFYAPVWAQAPVVRAAGGPALDGPRTNWLVFADESGVAEACAGQIVAAGHDAVIVEMTGRFKQIDRDRFTMDPFVRRDYDDLLKTLITSGRTPGIVLNCCGVGGDPADADAHIVLERQHHVLLWSLILTAQALADANVSGPVRIAAVTTGVHDVTGAESLSPGKATALGVCRAIPQEHPNLPCRTIDLASAADCLSRRSGIDTLLQEAAGDSGEASVALRGGHRWVQTYRPMQLEPPAGAPVRLRAGGVYLITGGLGDIALNFAEFLARAVQARLVLVGRSALPAESEWDEYIRNAGPRDLTAARIARLRRIRAAGGEAIVVQADVSNATQMAGAFAHAEARFGAVHGVIHAAGLVSGDAFRPVLETDEDVIRRQFQPKVDGLSVLDAIIRGRQLDFCMLVSSLSAILGGLRYGAYASANAFLDAFAHRRNRNGACPWITVNWDNWLRSEDEAELEKSGKPVGGYVMTTAEGVEAFRRILSSDAGTQVVVSTGDLQTRIDQWVRMTAFAEAPAETQAPAEQYRAARPNIQTDFVAPRTDRERQIAAVWGELLGLERVGVNDSFFELGGDSLLGIQLTAVLKRQLGVKVSAVALFEAPTVAALAAMFDVPDAESAPAAAFDASRERGERRREKKLRAMTSPETMGA